MLDRRLAAVFWIMAVMAAVVLGAANLLLGDLNQDEGWYLYAARMVAEGKLPYLDFATTQGPVMPFVYAAGWPLVESLGLAGGRLMTALLGLSASAGAALLGARLALPGRRSLAALAAFALAAVNVYQSYFSTIVKTYSLAAALLVLGFLALSYSAGKRRSPLAALAGVLLALAAATRTSAGAALPVVGLGLLAIAVRGGTPGADRDRRWLWFGCGGAATLAAVFLPFLLRAPQGVWFALVEYHAGRSGGNLAALLVRKAGFISRAVHAYSAAAFFCVALTAGTLFAKERASQEEPPPSNPTLLRPAMVWWAVLAVSLLHFIAPYPYDDYQVIVYPLLCAALAAGLARPAIDRRKGGAIATVVILVCGLAAFSSPINQAWFIGKRDRIWWPMKTATPLAVLRQTASEVRALAGSTDTLLTQDTYLAVEAGLRVPPGLEMGPFSYFPEWTRDQAQARRVLNREMFTRLLETNQARVAAFSGYGLSIAAPQIEPLDAAEQERLWQTVRSRFRPHSVVDPFGQADTRLQVLVRP